MNKADIAILEKAFAAEIDGTMGNSPIPAMIQGKSKRLLKLVEDGYLKPMHWESRDGLGKFSVDGYCLTLLGNAAYCFSCDDDNARP